MLQQEFNRNMNKPPSLLELCIQTAIDNLRYLGDVGETDLDILKIILSHCTPEQLLFIEDSTRGRDLSPVTDVLWMKFYEREFGEKDASELKKTLKEEGLIIKWKVLYQTKAEVEEKEQKRTLEKSLKRLKQLYAKADQKKQTKQIQICTKVPPTKRTKTYGGSGLRIDSSDGKGRLMKKAKMEFVASCNARRNATTTNSKSAQSMVPLGRISNMFTSSVKKSSSVTSRQVMNSNMSSNSSRSSSSVASRHMMNSNMSTTSSERSSSVTSRHAMNSNITTASAKSSLLVNSRNVMNRNSTASAKSSLLVNSRNVMNPNSTASRHVTNLNSSKTTVKISSTMASSAVMKLDNTVRGSSVNFKDSILQRKRKTL